MTVPIEYRRASELFEAFLKEAAEEAGLETRNQAFTMVDGVFRAFRRRLAPADAIAFARLLPPLLCALLVADWDPTEPLATDWERGTLTREVQALRRHHNFSPPTAIAATAAVLRRHIDPDALDALLARLPEGARAFWGGSGA